MGIEGSAYQEAPRSPWPHGRSASRQGGISGRRRSLILARLAMIEQAAKPKAALEFAVIPSIKKLVVAAAELPQLKASTPAEWQKHVNALATEEQSRLNK